LPGSKSPGSRSDHHDEGRCDHREGMSGRAAKVAVITTVMSLTWHAIGTLRTVGVSLG
jgi:hypothetical protein